MLFRSQALILLMAIYTVGNLAAALAPGYATLMAARVLTSLAHGAFFGLGAMVATSLVPPDKRASAVSAMFMGLTIANVGGVPMAHIHVALSDHECQHSKQHGRV